MHAARARLFPAPTATSMAAASAAMDAERQSATLLRAQRERAEAAAKLRAQLTTLSKAARSGSGSGGGTLPRSASSSGALNMLVRKSLSLPRRRAGSASAVGLDIATDPTDLMLTVPDTPVSRSSSHGSLISLGGDDPSAESLSSDDEGSRTTPLSARAASSAESLDGDRGAAFLASIQAFREIDLVRIDAAAAAGWQHADLMQRVEHPTNVRVATAFLDELAKRIPRSGKAGGSPSLTRGRRKPSTSSGSSGASGAAVAAAAAAAAASSSVPPSPRTSDDGPSSTAPTMDPRLFLVALITALFPNQVLRPNHDDLLHDVTKALVKAVADVMRKPGSKTKLARVGRRWTKFLIVFNDWKRASQNVLIQELLDQFLQMDRMWIDAKAQYEAQVRSTALAAPAVSSPDTDDMDVDPVLHTRAAIAAVRHAAVTTVAQLRARQHWLYHRLVRFGGGDAAPLLLDQLRRDRGYDFDLMRDDLSTLLGATLLGPPMPDSVCPDLDPLDLEADHAIALSVSVEVDEWDQVQRDLRLAHEIHFGAARAATRLPETVAPSPAAAAAVHGALKRAFRDQAEVQYHAGKLAPWLADCLEVLCENVAAGTHDAAAWRARLVAVAQVSAARAAGDNWPVADQVRVLHAVHAAMATLATHDRQADLAAVLISVHTVVPALFALLDVSELMRVDGAQRALDAMRPLVARTVVPLERAYFRVRVDHGLVDPRLPGVRAWLGAASARFQDPSGSARDVSDVGAAGDASFQQVYHEALVALIMDGGLDDVGGGPAYPETFAMDEARLDALCEQAHRVLLVAALATHLRNRVKAAPRGADHDVNASPSVAVERMRAGDLEGVCARLRAVVDAAASVDALRAALAAEVPGGRAIVDACLAKSDAVYKVLWRRLEATLRDALAAHAAAEADARLAAPLVTDGEARDEVVARPEPVWSVRKGLEAVEQGVRTLATAVVQLAQHNARVHAEWYDAVLGEVSRGVEDEEVEVAEVAEVEMRDA
ncbi:hypothetical protein AMAG_07709 [Allomyces macrogynus ATCC 38327]|uniref:Uncharacterized protein n=1 Tax=Allomyces macrogynus (strain ATCC 38327) TaxID=578462 RepID=A0A0L0SJF9_ALLM3|nr:hypothetical protein AMAG_07709 [Allomyces macrogynus ATCC 38327]|eukprot:KNE62495.1 hypothetical protein AMAG_07709 [Allomyces macrogynus ATCC 38327]